MANGRKVSVFLDLKDRLSPGFRQAANSVKGFSGNTVDSLRRVDTALSGTAAKPGAFGITPGIGAA